MKILNVLGRGIGIAALFALCAGAAHAQVWPTANPYSCDWTLGATSGKAFVTFQYFSPDTGALSRSGNLRTVYPTGSTVNKPFTLSWDWSSWSDYRFDFVQTQDNIRCTVITANAGKDVTFYPCSNGAWQHCVQ
jgi:hypothetical protein